MEYSTEFISLMGISNYKNVSDPLYSTTGAAMLDRLKSQGTIPTRSVGIALGRPADGTQGSLTFGGVDRNALKGDLIPASNVSIDHLYRVNITGVKVGESAIAVNDSLHNAVLDTGSSILTASVGVNIGTDTIFCPCSCSLSANGCYRCDWFPDHGLSLRS